MRDSLAGGPPARWFVICSGPVFAKICGLRFAPSSKTRKWANLRKYALETSLRERITKICTRPKSYYPRMHKTELGAWLESLVVAPHATHKSQNSSWTWSCVLDDVLEISSREVCSPCHPDTSAHGGTLLWLRPPATASQEPCLESPPTRFATAARTPAGPSRSRRSR